MLRYAITDRKLFSSREALLAQVRRWAEHGVDYIQVREKDLSRTDLTQLAGEIVRTVRSVPAHTKVLLNGPAEIVHRTGCDGLHLPSGMSAEEVEAACAANEMVSLSCHTVEEIETARKQGVSLILFAPIFEKKTAEGKIRGQGLAALHEACFAAGDIPVVALGGITFGNAADCTAAGAAGIAAIRLFAGEDWLHLI